MDEFIHFIESEKKQWSAAKPVPTNNDMYSAAITAVHAELGESQLFLLDPYKKVDLSKLPLPCFIAIPTAGDDPDTRVADYLANLRGPKREVEKPYLIYRLEPKYPGIFFNK